MISQFGKNPPWARDAATSVQQLSSISPPHLGLQIYSQQQAAVAPHTIFSIQPGIALSTSSACQVGKINYPSVTAVHGQSALSQVHQKQRVFTGVVTKLLDNFGFVDEDVFFQTSCVKGHVPKVGDRVLVEATYNATTPFKWNANRIQLLPSQPLPALAMTSQNSQTYHSTMETVQQSSLLFDAISSGCQLMPTTCNTVYQMTGHKSIMVSTPFGGGAGVSLLASSKMKHTGQSMNLISSCYQTEKQRDVREKIDSREDQRNKQMTRKRSRSPQGSKSSFLKSRSRSPKLRPQSPKRIRRTPRSVPRYTAHVPRFVLELKEADLTALRCRYASLYVPSDFSCASFLWPDAFPIYRPFQLGHASTFHVMHKTVEPLEKMAAPDDPIDADYSFSAKVMLLSSPPLDEIYHKSCSLADDPIDVRDNFQHPTRLLQFLVGLKGRNEPMAIGGPWSPSLDGPNPREDPRVLVNTAIRTTRALTGIDLSKCTQWYRFTEIQYFRQEEIHRGHQTSAQVESVTIFLPDVWNCSPTKLEWQDLSAEYKRVLDSKLVVAVGAEQKPEQEVPEVKTEPAKELDPKTMIVADLRHELESRNLSSKGLKSQLIARLMKALRSEQEREEMEAERTAALETMVVEDGKEENERDKEEGKQLEEEEKVKLEKKLLLEERYRLPDSPSILVHPSCVAKGGKFDCAVMSLSVLLDYRLDDSKEHQFEVSLFAEAFNEMLMRDFGFRIYKLLKSIPNELKNKQNGEKISKGKIIDDSKNDVKSSVTNEDAADKESENVEQLTDVRDKDGQPTSDGGSYVESYIDKMSLERSSRLMTIERDLLLAFVYFDQMHAGYLRCKDVEELLYTLGLQLSRAQVKKLVSKCSTHDTVVYRMFTDSQDGATNKTNSLHSGTPLLDDELLATGNKKRHICETRSPDQRFISYNGAIIDIDNIMEKLSKSENSRLDLESKLDDVQQELEKMRSVHEASEQTRENEKKELEEVKRTLHDQQTIKDEHESSSKIFHDMLMQTKSVLTALTTDIVKVISKKDTDDMKSSETSSKHS